MNIFKRLFKKEDKTYSNKEIAIELAKHLLDETSNEYEINVYLRLVNEKPSKCCTMDKLDKFIEKMNNIEGIIRYELLIKWRKENLIGEHSIQTKIDLLNNTINIKYQNDTKLEIILQKVNEIKNKIESMKITPTIEEKIKEVPKVEMISLGILGEFDLYKIEYKPENSQNELDKIRNVMNEFSKNINKINNNLFYEIHSSLDCVVANLWEDESFSKIVDIDKLPQEFNEISDEEKHKILFSFNEEPTKDNIIEITKIEKPFWNIDNIKTDVIIKSAIIDEEYHKLIIEFNGILNSFIAYVEFDYSNNFEMKNFDPC